MEKQGLLTEGKFFHGFFIRKISLIVVVAGKDIRDFTDRNISERINVVYDVFHPDDLVSVYDKVDHRFVAVWVAAFGTEMCHTAFKGLAECFAYFIRMFCDDNGTFGPVDTFHNEIDGLQSGSIGNDGI